MDQQENTKNTEKDQELQTEKQPESKIRPGRKCQICGGPNHHGCGCEHRARQETTAKNVLPTIHFEHGEKSVLCYSICGDDFTPGKNTVDPLGVTCPDCLRLMEPMNLTAPAAPEPAHDIADEIMANKFVAEARQLGIEQCNNIKQINERIGAVCDVSFDFIKLMESIEKFVKVIADDMITIRKILRDEYMEAEKSKNDGDTEKQN